MTLTNMSGPRFYINQNPQMDQETIEYKVARMELVEEIATKYVPENVLTNVSNNA
jgi:hypothetical protein